MTQTTVLQSRVIKTENVRWRELRFIQQEDFKEWVDSADQKLINSLIRYQFIDPFKVWQHKGKLYCLDGYHRVQDLKILSEKGWKIPEQLPATYVKCTDMAEAAELVLVYSSIYARITESGLQSFVDAYKIDLTEVERTLSLPDFSLDRFIQHFDQFESEDEPPVIIKKENVKVKPGDLFEINGHRIICADAKDHKSLDKLMKGNKIATVFTSPPYNMNAGMYAEYSDNMSKEDYLAMNVRVVDNMLRHLSGFLFYNISYNRNSRTDFIDILYRLKEIPNTSFLELIVWNKKTALPVVSDEMLTRQFEQVAMIATDDMLTNLEIFYLGSNQRKVFFNKRIGRTMSNYWEIPVTVDKVQFDNHSACFPVELPSRAIQLTTRKGEIVADPFFGMGTTLIAADNLERLCYATELIPAYVQGSMVRYINHCQKKGKKINFKHYQGRLTVNEILKD